MTDWPIGISTGGFFGRSIFDCLEPIAASGFSQVEICSLPRHFDYHDDPTIDRLVRRLDELALEAYSFHAPFADRIDITSENAAVREAAEAEIIRAATAAARLRVRHFVVHPGPEHVREPPPSEVRPKMTNAAQSLGRVARECRALGVSLVLENKLPHLVLSHMSDILWLLGELDESDVGVCLDTGHAHLSGDLPSVVQKLSGHLRMLHANDNRGQYDDHLAPGEGGIDWPALIRQLVANRFHGTVILELDGRPEPESVLATARRSRRYLRDLCRSTVVQRSA